MMMFSLRSEQRILPKPALFRAQWDSSLNRRTFISEVPRKKYSKISFLSSCPYLDKIKHLSKIGHELLV